MLLKYSSSEKQEKEYSSKMKELVNSIEIQEADIELSITKLNKIAYFSGDKFDWIVQRFLQISSATCCPVFSKYHNIHISPCPCIVDFVPSVSFKVIFDNWTSQNEEAKCIYLYNTADILLPQSQVAYL